MGIICKVLEDEIFLTTHSLFAFLFHNPILVCTNAKRFNLREGLGMWMHPSLDSQTTIFYKPVFLSQATCIADGSSMFSQYLGVPNIPAVDSFPELLLPHSTGVALPLTIRLTPFCFPP